MVSDSQNTLLVVSWQLTDRDVPATRGNRQPLYTCIPHFVEGVTNQRALRD